MQKYPASNRRGVNSKMGGVNFEEGLFKSSVLGLQRFVDQETFPEREQRRVQFIVSSWDWRDWEVFVKKVMKAELGDTYMKQDSGLQKAAPAGFCRAWFGYRHTSQLPKKYMEREG